MLGKISDALATCHTHLGEAEKLDMVNASTLLLIGRTWEPIGMLICYDVLHYVSCYQESLELVRGWVSM